MRRQLIAGAAAGLVLASGMAIPAQAISASSADLSVLHGIPGLDVDVYVNGANTLDNFSAGDLAGPLDLPAGTYTVVIVAAADANANTPLLGPIDIDLAANTSYTAVAHLKADGTPTVSLFTNDTSTIAAGQGRLTVRHVAAAPAVDILANGAAAFTNLVNPNEVKAALPVGTISAAVALAGTTAPVIGPADVAITDGVNTIVYAYGSAADSTLALAVQTITGLHSNPGGVNAGTAGLAADPDPAMVWIGAGTIAALALIAGTLVLRRRAGARS
jgi:Domain of unknown function (DUF4397)